MLQTLLLAASWHRFGRVTAPLEVLTIGQAPEALITFLTGLGVTVEQVSPGPNDALSKTSNTVLGTRPVAGSRVLLVDNDVVFCGSIDPLTQLDPEPIYGAISGHNRVKPSQWAHIADQLGLAPAAAPPTRALTSVVNALIRERPLPEPLKISYPNGGVLLFPAGADLGPVWSDHQARIAACFAGTDLISDAVTNSNMAALATTIGNYGAFDWLPDGYNYRHAGFALNLCKAEDIRMVHMTGLNTPRPSGSLSEWVTGYWSDKMLKKLTDLRPQITDADDKARRAIAQSVLEGVLETIQSYDLDPICRDMLTAREGRIA